MEVIQIKPIANRNKSDEAYDQILKWIAEKKLKKGDKIPSESNLVEMLHVGRNTVRTALNRLTAIGLIESRQGEGYFVRDLNISLYMNAILPVLVFSAGDVVALLQFRIGVESEAAGLAAINADEEDIQELERLLKLAEENEGDKEAISAIDMKFHFAVAKASKNDIFYQVYDIYTRLYNVWLTDFHSYLKIVKTSDYHRKVFEAIKNRDSQKAKMYMVMHLEGVLEEVQAVESQNL